MKQKNSKRLEVLCQSPKLKGDHAYAFTTFQYGFPLVMRFYPWKCEPT